MSELCVVLKPLERTMQNHNLLYAATKFQQLSNNNEGVRGMKTIKALKLMNEVSHTFLLSPTGS